MDRLNPDYYKAHSNGAEVIDISENLTGNGAQIVQYVARATHRNIYTRKGVTTAEWIEDLKKARWFLNREIERLSDKEEDFDPGIIKNTEE